MTTLDNLGLSPNIPTRLTIHLPARVRNALVAQARAHNRTPQQEAAEIITRAVHPAGVIGRVFCPACGASWDIIDENDDRAPCECGATLQILALVHDRPTPPPPASGNAGDADRRTEPTQTTGG